MTWWWSNRYWGSGIFIWNTSTFFSQSKDYGPGPSADQTPGGKLARTAVVSSTACGQYLPHHVHSHVPAANGTSRTGSGAGQPRGCSWRPQLPSSIPIPRVDDPPGDKCHCLRYRCRAGTGDAARYELSVKGKTPTRLLEKPLYAQDLKY